MRDLASYTPFETVIDALIEVSDEDLRGFLAGNADATLEQLGRLSCYPEYRVHQALLDLDRVGLAFPTGQDPDEVDTSWGARFLLEYCPEITPLLGDFIVREALALGETWHGSFDSLLEALDLVSR